MYSWKDYLNIIPTPGFYFRVRQMSFCAKYVIHVNMPSAHAKCKNKWKWDLYFRSKWFISFANRCNKCEMPLGNWQEMIASISTRECKRLKHPSAHVKHVAVISEGYFIKGKVVGMKHRLIKKVFNVKYHHHIFLQYVHFLHNVVCLFLIWPFFKRKKKITK